MLVKIDGVAAVTKPIKGRHHKIAIKADVVDNFAAAVLENGAIVASQALFNATIEFFILQRCCCCCNVIY